MQQFIITLIECSIAMTTLSLAYMIALPLLNKRYAAKWLYYIGLLIVGGWLFPYRPSFNFANVPINLPAILTMPYEPIAPSESSTPLSGALEIGSDITLWQVIFIMWLIGLFLVLALHVRRHLRFIRFVNRWSEDVAGTEVAAVFQSLKSEMNIANHVRLRVCPGIATPMLIGLFKPIVLLPQVQFHSEELTYILKHEFIHYKRKDLWLRTLVVLATAVHWFNPAVYFMAKSIAMQCEIACDEQLLNGTGFEMRKCYGETIIGIVRSKGEPRTSLSTNFYGGKKEMKARIFSLMDTRKKKAGAIVLCIALLAIIGAGTVFSGPRDYAKWPDALLDNIYQDGGYVFGGMPWLASIQDVKEQKQLNTDNQTNNIEMLAAEGTFPLDSSVKQTAVYKFQDGQLVSGEYLFSFTDKDSFAHFSSELEATLSQTMSEPFANDLSILKHADDASAQGKTVAWKGNDLSYLRITLFTGLEPDGEATYSILIQTTSPLPPRKELAQ